jgi:hypothetical protein
MTLNFLPHWFKVSCSKLWLWINQSWAFCQTLRTEQPWPFSQSPIYRVISALTSRATPKYRTPPVLRMGGRTARKTRVACFHAPHHVDPMLHTVIPSRSYYFVWHAPARRNPRRSQSPSPACGCCTADASVGLRRPRSDPRWRPSSCSRRVWQVGAIATVQHPIYFCNIQIKKLATYVRNRWNTCNIRLKHLQNSRKNLKTCV